MSMGFKKTSRSMDFADLAMANCLEQNRSIKLWGKLEKMDTKVYDERQSEVSRWSGSHTASTPKN
jgi:hypothetical protein